MLEEEGAPTRVYWRLTYNKSQKVLQLFDDLQDFKHAAEVNPF